jgi:hypothetical protein
MRALASIASTSVATVLLLAAPSHAQSAEQREPTCSDDGLGRGSRFVGRVDYGASSYVSPTPGTPVGFDLGFVAGFWFVASNRCRPWHLRVQPELALYLEFPTTRGAPLMARGRAAVALGPASMLAQFSYVPSITYGGARGQTGFGFQNGARVEALFGAAGFEVFHGYFPSATGDIHEVGIHGLIDVFAVIYVFAGFARLAGL